MRSPIRRRDPIVNEAAQAAAGAGLLTASFLFGMRHGIDVDHLAAIADITGVPDRARRSFGLASLYAAGHAFVLSVLGAAVILLGRSVPRGIETAMQRFVGATLVTLGAYLAIQLIRDPRALRLQSRWTLTARVARALMSRLRPPSTTVVLIEHEHEHPHGHHQPEGERELALASSRQIAGMPPHPAGALDGEGHTHKHRHIGRLPMDPFEGRAATAVATGAIHGVGAETPTQILLFVTAAGATSAIDGVLVLAAFVVGLFIANTLVAIVCIAGFRGGREVPYAYAALGSLTAVMSIMVGGFYLVGRGDLPARVFGG